MKYLLLVTVMLISAVCISAQEPKPTPILIAEFGKVSLKEAKAKFEPFYELLCSQSTSTGYVINYGTAEEVRARRNLLLKAMNDIHGCRFDPPRITLVDAVRESGVKTKLWVVPQGSDNPNP